jgi:hypothetical protein
MNDSNIISLIYDNENNYNKKTLKSIIDYLNKKYSLKILIDCIISKTTNNNKNKYNDNSELNKIISAICKEIGVVEVFKCLLSYKGEDQNNSIDQSLNLNKGNEEETYKRVSLSTTFEEEPIEISENNNDNTITINEDDEDNDNIISITDSEDNNNLDKKIINGNEHYSLTDKKVNKIKIININSDEKTNKIKIFDKNRLKNLSFHCSIIQGEYYKYKLKCINSKGIAKYICFNPKCEGYGIYNINNKMFTLLKEHNYDSNNNYSCCKYMDFQDKIYYSYMKNNNIEEMQIIND